MKNLDDIQFKFIWWVYYNWMPELKINETCITNISEYYYILYGIPIPLTQKKKVFVDVYYEEISMRLRLIIDNRKYSHKDKEMLNRVKRLYSLEFFNQSGELMYDLYLT